MFIITTEKKLRANSILRMLEEGDTWEAQVWPNEVRIDSWGAILARNPGAPWKHMKELYGTRKGETLILTGSGPSLEEALPFLERTKHPVMSINRSIRHVKAAYFVAHDADVIRELHGHPNYEAATKIVSCQALESFPGEEFYGVEVAGTPSRWPEPIRPLYWNEITLGWALHLAIRMGFDRIVTIGTDLTIGYPNGFIQPGRDADWLKAQHLGMIERTIEMFKADKDLWYERPAQILDASGGALPAPKVKLEALL